MTLNAFISQNSIQHKKLKKP